MNTLQNRHKFCNFSLTVSSIAAMVSTVQDDRWPTVPSTELAVRNCRRKLCNVYLFSKRERIRYVCYMPSQIRLSSVCLSVCDAGALYSAG